VYTPCARFLGRTAFNQQEDDQVSDKPTYEELENRIQQLEQISIQRKEQISIQRKEQISIQRKQLEDEFRESEENAVSWGTGGRYRP
jgi:uncharacterized protein YabE (DUF348 family)